MSVSVDSEEGYSCQRAHSMHMYDAVIAERLSTRQLIPHRVSPRVCMCVCVCVCVCLCVSMSVRAHTLTAPNVRDSPCNAWLE